MGLLGHVLGGLAEGIGTGITNQAIAQRQEALEATRQRHQTERDERTIQAQAERDKIQQGYNLDRDEQQALHGDRRVVLAGRVQDQQNASQHDRNLDRDALNREHERRMAVLQGNIASRRALEQDRRDGRRVHSSMLDEDGNIVVIYADGTTRNTGERAARSASGESQRPLTESEVRAATEDARERWIRDGRPGPEPTEALFIGQPATEYRANRNRPRPPAPGERSDLSGSGPARAGGRPSAGTGRPAARPRNNETPPIPGAQKAPDGNWYVRRGNRYLRVDQ